jgi:hypothetical protein
MARHTRSPGSRLARLTAVAVLWLAGLGVGFYAILSVGARYGCATNDNALACRSSGTALGVLIVIAVVLVVSAGTVLAQDAPDWRRRVGLVVAALFLLGLCLLAAHALLATV